MNIIIIGAGGGNVSTYTQEALEAMQGAQVILGAERILAGVPVKNSDVKYWEVSRPSEVCDALANFTERRHRVLFRLQISCRKNERSLRI